MNDDDDIDKEMEEAIAARAHGRAKTIQLDDGLDIDSDGSNHTDAAGTRAPPSESLIVPTKAIIDPSAR